MGTDIHAFVEMFDGQRWSWNQGDLFDNGTGPGASPPYEPFDRSYVLFGFLADVRNHNVPQIHPCRGLPADLSPELRARLGPTAGELMDGKVKQWDRVDALQEWNGLFGHSWATGAELVGYDFTTRMRCTYRHGADRPTWDKEPCPHEAVDPVFTTVGEYLGVWPDRFREIAALADDPNHVRVVYAFDN